jgi:hypothetical protein
MRRLLFVGVLLIIGIVLIVFLVSTSRVTPDGTIVVDPIDANELGETAVEVSEATSQNLADMFSDFVARLYTIPRNDVVRVLMVIGGAFLLLAGWRFYNWIIILAGVFIGGSLAVAIVNSPDTNIDIIAFLIGAVIGAALATLLYRVAVFFIGGYFGVIFASMVANSLGWGPLPYWALLIVLIIGGLIMLTLSSELLLVLASVLGAQLIVIALGLTPASLWILGLALLGIILQSGIMRRFGYGFRRRYSGPLL